MNTQDPSNLNIYTDPDLIKVNDDLITSIMSQSTSIFKVSLESENTPKRIIECQNIIAQQKVMEELILERGRILNRYIEYTKSQEE